MSTFRIFSYVKRRTTPMKGMDLKKGRCKVDRPSSLGVEFNYESMEDELTCPVCLELYADPLMLPCSHSVCKKCIHDILDSKTKKKRSKKEAVQLECPSCRKEIIVGGPGSGKDKLGTLPRNLALENVVIRYTEERSRSIRNSLHLESPLCDVLLSGSGNGNGNSSSSGSENTPQSERRTSRDNTSTLCELCHEECAGGSGGGMLGASGGYAGGEGGYNPAAWYCEQCQVGYCHACIAKYHPKRGALAKHKIRPFIQEEDGEGGCGGRTLMCTEHAGEAAILFCDTCQTPACPLCVCEGQGQHGGHRMLGHQVAVKKVEESVKKAKDESDWLVGTVNERKGKMEARAEEIKDLHAAVAARVDQQYKRLVADITSALQQERERSLEELLKTKEAALKQTKGYVKESNNLAGKVETLSSAFHKFSTAKHSSETLCRAKEVAPLVEQLRTFQKEMEGMRTDYDSTIKNKSTLVTLQTAVTKFSKSAMKVIQTMMDDRASGFPSLVPRILTPAATSGTSQLRAATAELAPRMLNKSPLITWGFSSTTFTGERLSQNATWTVSVEKNVAGGGGGNSASSSSSASASSQLVQNAGYVFGVGISSEVLHVKDAVGAAHGAISGAGARSGASFSSGSSFNSNTMNRSGNGGSGGSSSSASTLLALSGASTSSSSSSTSSSLQTPTSSSSSSFNSSTTSQHFTGNSKFSYGVVVSGGTLCFAHAGKMEVLEKLSTLPVSVTLSVGLDVDDYVVVAYKIEGQGLSLLGNKVIRDPALKKQVFPVFTVSQRVKLLFPTNV